ncbi:MAG: hypothetical protein JHC93_01480 [Parachlamydiales bacterium]|nr:hypothetical protein [Parachlamydiales bacterium]
MHSLFLLVLITALTALSTPTFAAKADSNLKKDFVVVEDLVVEVDALESINQLIEMTKQNLVVQEKLASLINEFKEARKVFRDGNDDKKVASLIIRNAYEIQELVNENYLTHLFNPEFLSEIKVIAQMVNRQSLNRAQ